MNLMNHKKIIYLKLIEYTNQDCFTFEAAQCLNDAQIDIMIEKKKRTCLIIMP